VPYFLFECFEHNQRGQAEVSPVEGVNNRGQTDHLNTPRLITNQTGQAVWRYDNNDPFGGNPSDENPSGLGTFTCNLRFPGTYADQETGLLYNWHRTLDSGIGRYIRADPLGIVLPGFPTRRLNQPYAYADNNPLTNVDPLGLCPCAGGVWDQEFGDSQASVAAGIYLSVAKINYTCRSNPSLKCSGRQSCIGGGPIIGGGGELQHRGYCSRHERFEQPRWLVRFKCDH
jgi:RHS repeat-associated protein